MFDNFKSARNKTVGGFQKGGNAFIAIIQFLLNPIIMLVYSVIILGLTLYFNPIVFEEPFLFLKVFAWNLVGIPLELIFGISHLFINFIYYIIVFLANAGTSVLALILNFIIGLIEFGVQLIILGIVLVVSLIITGIVFVLAVFAAIINWVRNWIYILLTWIVDMGILGVLAVIANKFPIVEIRGELKDLLVMFKVGDYYVFEKDSDGKLKGALVKSLFDFWPELEVDFSIIELPVPEFNLDFKVKGMNWKYKPLDIYGTLSKIESDLGLETLLGDYIEEGVDDLASIWGEDEQGNPYIDNPKFILRGLRYACRTLY